MSEAARKLAEEHWSYVCALLKAHSTDDSIVTIVRFHYVEAFVHGFKHGQEEVRG